MTKNDFKSVNCNKRNTKKYVQNFFQNAALLSVTIYDFVLLTGFSLYHNESTNVWCILSTAKIASPIAIDLAF